MIMSDRKNGAITERVAPDRDHAGRFRAGNAGRPKGTGKAARIAKAISDDELRRIVAALVEEAKAGNVKAAGLLLARTMPPLKPISEPVRFRFPDDATLSDKADAIVNAIAAGKLPPDVGAQLIQTLATTARIIEIDELERRIAALEEQTDGIA